MWVVGDKYRVESTGVVYTVSRLVDHNEGVRKKVGAVEYVEMLPDREYGIVCREGIEVCHVELRRIFLKSRDLENFVNNKIIVKL
jgi:hypothetical protein